MVRCEWTGGKKSEGGGGDAAPCFPSVTQQRLLPNGHRQSCRHERDYVTAEVDPRPRKIKPTPEASEASEAEFSPAAPSVAAVAPSSSFFHFECVCFSLLRGKLPLSPFNRRLLTSTEPSRSADTAAKPGPKYLDSSIGANSGFCFLIFPKAVAPDGAGGPRPSAGTGRASCIQGQRSGDDLGSVVRKHAGELECVQEMNSAADSHGPSTSARMCVFVCARDG